MNAERAIVNHWLNSKGYFTINNVNGYGNKNIGILGLKFNNEELQEVVHAEVSCSITFLSSEDKELKKILKKFVDNTIAKAINNHLGARKTSYKLRNLLVAGKLPETAKENMKKGFAEKEIELLEFEDVILEVMLSLETPYYKDDVLRALQLVKYILLSEPKKLAELLSDKGDILNVNSRGVFLNQLLKQELIKKGFTKANEEQIIDILRHTELRKPHKLAKALENELLNKRGMSRLKSILLADNKQEKPKVKDVKHLSEFF